ncbi:3-dehydrosphinganine reductase TSC10A-like protein [Tanacetum coccineum]
MVAGDSCRGWINEQPEMHRRKSVAAATAVSVKGVLSALSSFGRDRSGKPSGHGLLDQLLSMLQVQEAHAAEMDHTFIAIKPDSVQRGLRLLTAQEELQNLLEREKKLKGADGTVAQDTGSRSTHIEETICEESHLAIETIGHGATKENHVARLQNNSLRPVVRKLTMLGANNKVCEVSILSTTREGARITILACNLKNLEGAKTSIRLLTGIDDNIVSADVRDFEAVKEAVVSMGTIDVLVCDQGVFVLQELEKHEINKVKDMIDVNLVGTFNVVKAPFLGMKNRSDRKPVLIVFMSSQAGQASNLMVFRVESGNHYKRDAEVYR